jgi:pre-mRNA-splicing factor 38B
LTSDDLLKRVLENERNASAAVGKNYGHRPASYKGSLSLKVDRYTVRRKSPSPDSYRPVVRRVRSRSRSPPNQHRSKDNSSSSSSSSSNNNSSGSSVNQSVNEQMRRMQMLKQRYGDASSALK